MRQAQKSPDLDKEEKEGRCSEGGVRCGRRQGTVDRVQGDYSSCSNDRIHEASLRIV